MAKTYRKMIINAFEKAARDRGWHDSKITPNCMSHYGFKSARSWAREMASWYDVDAHYLDQDLALVEMIEDAAREDRPLTQADFDDFVRDEIYYMS